MKVKASYIKDRDGRMWTVRVGDTVEFKSDIEQCGVVREIREEGFRTVLVVENPQGFSGHYLRGATRTEILSEDCWK